MNTVSDEQPLGATGVIHIECRKPSGEPSEYLVRRAVKRIVRQTPATRLGHMHRIGASLVSLDPEPNPQWIIVDPGGRVLSTMPAKKIVNRMAGVAADAADLADDTIVRQHSNDPAGDHSYKETFRQSYPEDAELVARSVFPVCALRETACGYDILLS